jgi:hypothetical protein
VRLEVLMAKMMMLFWVCDNVYTDRQIPVFWRNIMSSSSGLKTETVCFSKILLSTCESTQHHNPEKHCHLKGRTVHSEDSRLLGCSAMRLV